MVEAYREQMEQIHPSLGGTLVKKAKMESADEVIFKELDLLNLKYQLLSDSLYQKLQNLAIAAAEEDPSFDVCLIFNF